MRARIAVTRSLRIPDARCGRDSEDVASFL